MNWLAHVFLSPPAEIDFQLGNLLADLVRGDERRGMSAQFLRGVQCHKAIDRYTDAHPVVLRSRARIGGEYRRFSGVLVDIFYDHLLATRWGAYAAVPLNRFTADFYTAVQRRGMPLPEQAQLTLGHILHNDLLGSYQHLTGVERALARLSAYLSRRWGREFALARSIAILRAQEQGFIADFIEFFPQLQEYVAREESGEG
ncbi:hypothetical protein ACG33_11120 [Steroidobacter denitrificans]|uniref:ACP phosphodiesterase n=1 Tax=Steroidobacter denitrificans TaxID=465721 RepID=A0A127FD74_STEDE|nr:ACP phosphodiesterase [Steroidobacter denitrificans]AMN47640.1 hypothetical protein ACG33_11120 [Steroidobacter denitrificans]